MSAGEQARDRVGRQHAAGDTGGRGQRGAEEARTLPLEHARLVVRRILRRRRWRVVALLRAALWTALPPAPRTGARRRRGLLLIAPTAEQSAEEATAGALLRRLLRLLKLLLQLLVLVLQLLDAVLRLDQRGLLHEGKLCDAVARLRILLEFLGDQRVRVAIHRRQGRLGLRHGAEGGARVGRRAADAGDELVYDPAFFVGHVCPDGS